MAYALNCADFAMPWRLYFCLCHAVQTVAYRAYAIRPYKSRKTIIAHSFQNVPKITFDVEKTMSYVEKIISDII